MEVEVGGGAIGSNHNITSFYQKGDEIQPEIRAHLDAIGEKCNNLSNHTSSSFLRMIPILQIQKHELECISENLYIPKAGSFTSLVSKYLSKKHRLQIVVYQRPPGFFDKSQRRTPTGYTLEIILQGNLEVHEIPEDTIETKLNELLTCIFFSLYLSSFFRYIISDTIRYFNKH